MNIKIKRILICTIIFIITLIFQDKLFAKDLIYRAKVDNELNSNRQYLTYANYVKSYSPGDGILKDKYEDITGREGGKSSYKSNGIIFHKNYGSIYSEGKNSISRNQLVYYDISNENLDPSSMGLYRDAYIQKVRFGSTFVGGNGNSEKNEIFRISSSNKQDLDENDSLVNIQSRTDENYFTENRFKIGPNSTSKLLEELQNNNNQINEGLYSIKFSNILNFNGNNYETANDMYYAMESSWEVRNYGMWDLWNEDGNPYGLNNEKWLSELDRYTTHWFAAGSVLNEYDNEILIPVLSENNTRNIFVEHLVDADDGKGEVRRIASNSLAYKDNAEDPYENQAAGLPDQYEANGGIYKIDGGWSEKYSTNEVIQTTNILDELGSNDYELTGWSITPVDSEGNKNGNSAIASGDYYTTGDVSNDKYSTRLYFDAGEKAVAIGEDVKSQDPQSFGITYHYKKKSIVPKKVIVGHSVYNNNPQMSYNQLYDSRITDFKGKELINGSVRSKDAEFDSWMNVYNYTDSSINVKIPTSTTLGGTKYNCVGYKIVKFSGNNTATLHTTLRNGMRTAGKSTYPTNGVNASANYTMIIFLYSKDSPPPGNISAGISVKGWLDYANQTDSKYKNATTKEYSNNECTTYNDNEPISIYKNFREEADVVPSDGKLKPYIRTAPFIIMGIKSGYTNQHVVKSGTCKITVEYEEEVPSKNPITGTITYSTVTKSKTFNKDINVDIEWSKYQIDNLTIAGISGDIILHYPSSDPNKNGGKIFENGDNIKFGTNLNYNNINIKSQNPNFTVVLNTTEYRTTSKSASDAESAADDLIKNGVIYAKEVTYDIYDDDINVGKYKNILESKKYEKGRVSVSNNKATINPFAIKESENKQYYNDKIKSYMQWNIPERYAQMTKVEDFNSNELLISSDHSRENGIRSLEATVTYKNVYTTNSSYKPTLYSTSSGPTEGNGNSLTFNENMTLELNNNSDSLPRSRKIDIYDPINFGEWKDMVETSGAIDHSIGSGAGTTLVLQPNTNFTIVPKLNGKTTVKGYNMSENDIKDYIQYYNFYFNFEVIYKGNTVAAGNKIKIDNTNNESDFTFRTPNDFHALQVNGNDTNVRIIAVSKNATNDLKNYVYENYYVRSSDLVMQNAKYISTNKKYNEFLSNITGKDQYNQSGYLSNNNITYSSNHVATTALSDNGTTANKLFRMYDFAITDCSDLSFKDVFRKTDDNNVNQSTSKPYWSGIRKLQIQNDTASKDNNLLIDRDMYGNASDGIGSSDPKRILPLGPYKNTSSTIIQAPKLGYRISFDLKTTGRLNSFDDRKIVIIPRYYYIPKDGDKSKYVSPENLKLYYKSTFGIYKELAEYKLKDTISKTITGKYIQPSTSASHYNISFKPNDGYRYLRNLSITENTSYLTSKEVKLDISKIVLTANMMTEDYNYIQAWYGEFKLPNSTIAVKNENGKYDITKPLSDGYIGVIFDIYCEDKNGFTLSYSQNSRDDNQKEIHNTSQWDYEGFLKLPNYGEDANNLKLQLEKGTLNIDDDMYNKMKGTVLLYDIDERAANDYN